MQHQHAQKVHVDVDQKVVQINSFVCFNLLGVPEGWGLCCMTIHKQQDLLLITQKCKRKQIFKHFHWLDKTFQQLLLDIISN